MSGVCSVLLCSVLRLADRARLEQERFLPNVVCVHVHCILHIPLSIPTRGICISPNIICVHVQCTFNDYGSIITIHYMVLFAVRRRKSGKELHCIFID